MATPQLPEIFLSHSGVQKGFVWNLYRELLHVQHNPFFDQDTRVDSLPKGIPFPPRILQACRACKLGVVVLSHEYIESLWPMLELQQFLFHNPHSPYIFPLFYKLKPADLSKEENLTRWRLTWEEKAASWKRRVQHMHTEDPGTSSSISVSQTAMDMSLWPQALERLGSQSGQTLPDNKDEPSFVRAIVSNICKILPPPQSFVMGSHYKGAAHIQEEIDELFQQQQSYPEIDDSGGRMPICVGLHGVGGSGKTTVCKYMLNFYATEYSGSCCFVQLPSNKNEGHLLVQSMKDVLSRHGNWNEETIKMITTVEQVMGPFQELLKRSRVFLVVDNIWDWALQDVNQILAMEYMKDSRLLVTARSRHVLQNLNPSLNDSDGRGRPAMQIHHVPSISEAEAIESLKAYSLSSLQGCENADDVLRRLANCCIFDGQCHPLLLKAVGAKLRYLVGSRHRTKDLENLLSRLQALRMCGDDDGIEEEVVSVLRTSYDALNPKLQKFLLLLGTCVPKEMEAHPTLSVIRWLSRVCDDSGSQSTEEYIRSQIIELEYHGLLQWPDEEGLVNIHDVQRMMIDKIVRGNNDAPKRFFFEGDVTTLSESHWRSLKYVRGSGCQLPDRISDVEVLAFTTGKHHKFGMPGLSMGPLLWVVHLGRMQFLRHLHLSHCTKLTEVRGWGGAPNLVSVRIQGICADLRIIEPMSCLSSLKELELIALDSWENAEAMLSSLSACTALQRCILECNSRISKFTSSLNGRDWGPTSLEVLSLDGCWNLKSMPDLKHLIKLRTLKVGMCNRLKEAVKVGEATVRTLEELSLDFGRSRLSTGLCLELPISAFSNLRKLWLWGVYNDERGWFTFDVGSISLPTSLEKLSLHGFPKAQEMPDLSALVNLKQLEVWQCKSLIRMTGLGPLTKLESLAIGCYDALREVRHEGPSSNLECVDICLCRKLEILSIKVGFLRSYVIVKCPLVRKEMLPDEVSGCWRNGTVHWVRDVTGSTLIDSLVYGVV